jgi:AGZA family xanthine/uracil permease-like MFS transporter
LIGCLMGNPFILAVYIGQPGWKAIGGRIGYSAATGILVIFLAWFGIISVMMALIPVVAIAPILLYIGMLIGSQAFLETPRSHAPAIILGLVPHVAAWGKLQIEGALGAAGTTVATVGLDKLGQVGVLYHGLQVIGGGAILGGLVLTSIAVFVIDRSFSRAGVFALVGAVFTFFGFMHGEAIGFAQSPVVALSYLGVASIMFGCARYATPALPAVEIDSHVAVDQTTG